MSVCHTSFDSGEPEDSVWINSSLDLTFTLSENVVFFICFYSDLRQNLKTFSYLFKKRFGLHLIFPNQVSAFYYDVIQFINQNMKNKSSSAETIRGKNYVGFL